MPLAIDLDFPRVLVNLRDIIDRIVNGIEFRNGQIAKHLFICVGANLRRL
ncbi:hypothetical protein [Agrobacterium cavarae]|nr:hypothetical protein [Agrobacterium cavarae]